MKNNLLKLMSFFLAVLALTSCGSKGLDVAQYIPKKSSMVMIIDQKKMNDKLKDGNFSMDSLINILSDDKDSSKVKKLMSNSTETGLSTDDKMVFFLNQTGSAFKNTALMQFNLIAKVKDAAKFEKFLKETDEFKTQPIEKGKKYSTINIDNIGCITWTSDVAIMSVGHHSNTPSLNFSDSTSRLNSFDVVAAVKKNVDGFYNLQNTEKISSIETFNEMFKEESDAYMFSSMDLSSLQMGSVSMMPKLEELLAGNYTVSHISFDKGKIAARATTHFNPQLTSLLKQYGNGSVNISTLENFPAKQTNAALLISFKPEMMHGIMKELQFESFADVILSQMGFNMQDIYKCINGDMQFAMGDLEFPIKDSAGNKKAEAKMTYVFNAEVNDKLSLKKILSKAVESKFLVENNGVYTLGTAIPVNMFVRIDDKNIIVASSEETYKNYIAKSMKANWDKDFASNAKGKSSALFVDINSLIKSIPLSEVKDKHVLNMMNMANNVFENVTAYSNHVENGKLTGTFEVKMKNDKENSLVVLAKFMKMMISEGKEYDKENNVSQVNKSYSSFLGMIN